jgi:hypothetical protein
VGTIQQLIAEKFLTRLADSKKIDAAAIEQLRALFADSKKLKPDDLVKVFTSPTDGEIK